MSSIRIQVFYLNDFEPRVVFKRLCEIISMFQRGNSEWKNRVFRKRGGGYLLDDSSTVKVDDVLKSADLYSDNVWEYAVSTSIPCIRYYSGEPEDGEVEVALRGASIPKANSLGKYSRYFQPCLEIEIEPAAPFYSIERCEGVDIKAIRCSVLENNKLLVNLILTLAENMDLSIIKVFSECNPSIFNSNFTFYRDRSILLDDLNAFLAQIRGEAGYRNHIDLNAIEPNEYDMHLYRSAHQRKSLWDYLKSNHYKIGLVTLETVDSFFDKKTFPYFSLRTGVGVAGNTLYVMDHLVEQFYKELFEEAGLMFGK